MYTGTSNYFSTEYLGNYYNYQRANDRILEEIIKNPDKSLNDFYISENDIIPEENTQLQATQYQLNKLWQVFRNGEFIDEFFTEKEANLYVVKLCQNEKDLIRNYVVHKKDAPISW